MSTFEQNIFDDSIRHSQREVYGIDPAAFLPRVSTVFYEPGAQKVLLVPGDTGLVFPSIGFKTTEPVRDAFARLAVDEMGIAPGAITRVGGLYVDRELLISEGPGRLLEYHIGLRATVTGMDDPRYEGVEWVEATAAHDKLAYNSNVMQRDLGTMMLRRFIGSPAM